MISQAAYHSLMMLCECLSRLYLPDVLFAALRLPLLLAECFPPPQSQPELSRNVLSPINLERWYQDIMAAGEPQPCPPPLPAKSFSTRRQGQVNSPRLLPHGSLLSLSSVFNCIEFRVLLTAGQIHCQHCVKTKSR